MNSGLLKRNQMTNCAVYCIILIVMFFSSLSLLAPPRKGPELSNERISMVQKIIMSFIRNGENLNNPDTIAAIFQKIGENLSLTPEEKPDTRTTKELYVEARKEAAKKFPFSMAEIAKRARKAADKKYKVAQEGDEVVLYYYRGGKRYKAKGKFYYGKNSVVIRDRPIAVFDLDDESKSKVIKKYCEDKKEKYISQKCREYASRKSMHTTDIFRGLRANQVNKNEKAGYIYCSKQWMTPKEVTSIMISTAKAKLERMAAAKKERARKAREAAAVAGKDGTGAPASPTAPPDTLPRDREPPVARTGKKTDSSVASRTPANPDAAPVDDSAKIPYNMMAKSYEELMKRAKEKQLEIAGKYAGIDADQGYKYAMWGDKRSEVELLLFGKEDKGASPEAAEEGKSAPDAGYTVVKTDNSIILKYAEGPIQQIELNFAYDLFYQVVIKFRIATDEAMKALYQRFTSIYGHTDETKQDLKKTKVSSERFAQEELAGDVKDVKKEEPKKKKQPKKPKPVPVEPGLPGEEGIEKKKANALNAHWTGEITRGTLTIILNSQNQCQEFILTRESPSIKETAKAYSIQERQRIENEKRRKVLETYRKTNIDI